MRERAEENTSSAAAARLQLAQNWKGRALRRQGHPQLTHSSFPERNQPQSQHRERSDLAFSEEVVAEMDKARSKKRRKILQACLKKLSRTHSSILVFIFACQNGRKTAQRKKKNPRKRMDEEKQMSVIYKLKGKSATRAGRPSRPSKANAVAAAVEPSICGELSWF